MPTTISSEFRLRGKNFDPLNFIDRIPLKPTRIWKEGDSIQNSPKLRRKDNAWILGIQEEVSMSVEDQMQKLLNQLIPYSNKIISVCQDLDLEAEFSFGVYIEGNNTPSIYLSKNIIGQIAQLNALLDIDLICV